MKYETIFQKGKNMQMDEIFDFDNKVIKNDFIIKKYNLLIWPLIREKFLYQILRKKMKATEPHAKQPVISTRNLKYFLNSLLYAPHKQNENYKIIFYVPARGRIDHRDFNIYSDYYSFLTKKTLVVDNAYRGRYILPSESNNFATGDYGKLKSFLLSQIKNLFLKTKNQDIERFMGFLIKEDLFEKKCCKNIRKKIYEFYLGYNYYKSYHSKVFKKINPKILFVNAASYGQYKAILIKTANEKGILTAEFQHGTISKGHLAYNYGEEVFKSEEYKKYLPDYILTYGDYWNKQMNIPCEKITIGAPHFYESIKKYKNVKEKKKTILIVSQGIITELFVEISRYLAEKLPKYKIIFKLHPGEVPFEDRYNSLYKYANIKVAKSGDIYRYIAESENIVACYSTTIFEAMGFNKNIFVLDNEASRRHIPKDIGVRFKEKKGLSEIIKDNKTNNKSYDLEYYFNSNWKENYEKFLAEKVNL